MRMHCTNCGVEKEEERLLVSERGMLCHPCEAKATGHFGGIRWTSDRTYEIGNDAGGNEGSEG